MSFTSLQACSMSFSHLQSTFPRLYSDLQFNDTNLWTQFVRSSQCEQDFPSSVAKKLSLFQQLLVVQATRPDRLQSAMALFAAKALSTRCRYQIQF